MKLATQDHDSFGKTFKEKLANVQAAGFEGLELDGQVLINHFDEIKSAVKALGVPISSTCGGYRGWIGDFDEENRRNAIEDIKEIMKYTAEIGAEGVVVPAAWGMFSKRLPPLTPPRSEEEDREVLLDSLYQLNQGANEYGGKLLLEPLNRYEDYMINRLSDAVSLIEEGNFANVRVIADFFHMNIEEAEIGESLRNAKDFIGHIHLADSSRHQPGTGHLDFNPGFEALREIGYDKYMALECRIIGNPSEAYPEAVRYLKGFM
ncbi:MAG TPA: sugar phosphate isomerase/epimerase family protein [Bacillales bacterium]